MIKLSGITARTTLLAWTVTLLTLIIFVVILIPEQKRDLRDGLESKARGVAAALQGEVAGAAVSEDYTSVVDHAQQVLAGDQTVDFLVVTKNDGFSIVVERNSWRQVPAIDAYWHPMLRRSLGAIEQVPLFNQRLYHYASPFDYSGLEWGWIHVGLSLDSYDRSVNLVYRRTAIMAVICILLGLFASILYAKHFVGPILELRGVVEELASGDFMARANINSKDEIKELADAFNDMADAIVQRNLIVESVRFTAQTLQSTNDWKHAIEPVLAKVGLASHASRVLVGIMPELQAGRAAFQFEWSASDIAGEEQRRHDLRFAEVGLEQQAKRLAGGETTVVRCADLNCLPTEKHDAPWLSEIIAPILLGDVLWGALVMQDCLHNKEWGEAEQDSVRAVAEMLSASILRQQTQQALVEAKLELERRVAERTSELQKQIVAKDQAHADLEEAQKRLIEVSRISGMAEVATGVLHNVGNVLNSINVSTTIISDRLRASRISQLRGVSDLLKENQPSIGDFLADDPKGQRILPYLDKLSSHLVQERDELSIELEGLVQHVGHIKEIVAMQQTYARTSGVLETLSISTLIEDALRMTQAEMDRHGVTVRKEIDGVPSMTTDRHKVLQILLNLLRNAKDAVKVNMSSREITVRAHCVGEDRVQFQLADNGVGIPTDNLARIFSHGFTTKKDGHGFGLHSGALTARQLGGSLSVESAGLSHGATFTLELPIHPTKPAEHDDRRVQ